MANENDLAVSLEEFGLSKYESRAYVSLISKGTISASELAYYSNLPRTKIYPTLKKLEKKQLAIISKSKPIMCTAIAPEDAFDDIIHEQINKVNAMNTLVSNLKKTSEESRKSRGSEEKRYLHLTANNVLSQLRVMIDGSKSTINMIADQWGLGLLAECREQLASVIRRKIDVKLIVHTNQVCSESFKSIPRDVKIRMSDIVQNCFIFDDTELLVIDSKNGKGATFSSTDILATNQTMLFTSIWNNATRTEYLADMTKLEAQEINKIIKTVNEKGLFYILNSMYKKSNIDMLKLLEKNGINLKYSLDDIIDMMDIVLQLTCSGHAQFEEGSKIITVESKLNSGHSLPWVSILEGWLQRRGYNTRTIHSKNEKIHIKLSKN